VRNRPSHTAQQVALFRALESARGARRLFDDSLAVAFLPSYYRLLTRLIGLPLVGRAMSGCLDRLGLAHPRTTTVVRTRLIDDLLVDALTDGARQVVVLGAGYDSRAYRIPALAAVAVFEVDHPATQAAKRRHLQGLVDPQRLAEVRFVPVNFEHDDAAAALRTAGFADEISVVVWEGVTTYLTAEAVDTTMRWLATMAAGTRIIFTYVDRRVLAGPTPRIALAVQERLTGERWRFGIDPTELPDFLAARGLRLTTDLTTRQAADRYLTPLERHESTTESYHIAHAVVEPSS
jgi:methyltransferase (TIGR00027 family)